MKTQAQKWFLIVTLSLWTQLGVAAIPDSISYQGYLTDPSGNALDGSQFIQFSIYNVNAGGVPLWSDIRSVNVSKGLFSIQLGGSGAPFPPGLFDDPLWLGIDVNSDGEMSPRRPFDSAAFAFNADTLEGQSASSLDQSAHVTDGGNPHGVTVAQTGAASTADIAAHAGDDSAHHAEYTDTDAQGAMGTKGDGNALHHDRYADVEATAAILAADGSGSGLDADTLDGVNSTAFMGAAADNWVNTTGDTMSGALTVNADINTTGGYQIGGIAVVQTPGTDNIFLGKGAGMSNTTGSSNTFLGYQAGFTNTTETGNTFSGFQAGHNNTAHRNTFLGSDAGFSNTTGIKNTFLGYRAGNTNTTESDNTFSGYRAGHNNTGHSNTFLGSNAGFSNTTGNENTFLGYRAGIFNKTGKNNTFSGYRAGGSNTVGNENTFSGTAAGENNTTGSSNTILGYQAGQSNTAGNRNVFLGYRAGLNETGSDKLYIDNTDTSTPLIWGDFAANFLDVNGRLHVKRDTNGAASTPNHVAIIESTSTGTSPDVLALKIGMTTDPDGGVNFISFHNGAGNSLGAIQGNGAGSVTLAGAGNDYAEYLPRLNKDEMIVQGDIVGVFDGTVSKHTQGANRAMVVSSNPIVSGNDPGEDKRGEHSLIAFVGQATVKVRGMVKAGDYLIPDGEDQGVGIAISPEAISAEQFTMVVGQAWESSAQVDVKKIRALIGLQHANPVITKLVAENRTQAEEITQLRADLSGVIQQVVYMQKTQEQEMRSVKLEQ